jgi:hypothetical protein
LELESEPPWFQWLLRPWSRMPRPLPDPDMFGSAAATSSKADAAFGMMATGVDRPAA